MSKEISLVLLVICTVIFIARSQNTEESDVPNIYEKYKDISIGKLTPIQQTIFNTTAEQLDVSIDDVIFFVKTYAKRISNLINSKSSFSSYATQLADFNSVEQKISEQIAEYNDINEITIKILSRDHPKLWKKLIQKTQATPEELLILIKVIVLIKQYNPYENVSILGGVSAVVMKRIQYEPSICPVPPEKINGKFTSKQLRKYSQQVFPEDGDFNKPITSQTVESITNHCGVPSPILKKIDALCNIWKQLSHFEYAVFDYGSEYIL